MFEVRDSGEREVYDSGMVRDTQDGKPDFTLIPLFMLERWAMHMTRGAKKYGRENWMLAASREEYIRFRASAFRHLVQWLRGDRDEDHAAAVYFNLAAAEYVYERMMNDAANDEGCASPARTESEEGYGGTEPRSSCSACRAAISYRVPRDTEGGSERAREEPFDPFDFDFLSSPSHG